MKPLMYRQRPAYPALIFSACALVVGAACVLWLRGKADAGLASESSVLFVAFISLSVKVGLVRGSVKSRLVLRELATKERKECKGLGACFYGQKDERFIPNHLEQK